MKWRGALGGIVVALACTLAACGGGDRGQASVSIKTLRAAAENTQAAESSRFMMDMKVDVAGESVTIHGEGVASGDGKTGQVTMTIPSAGTLQERIVDGTIYMNFGDLLGPVAGKALGGKKWVKFDVDAATDGMFSQLADQPEANGPRQGLEYLQGLSGDVEKIGDDSVAGQHATHYRASIDYSKVAAELPDGSAELRDQLARLGTVPADIWIDDQDRVVKMQFAVDGAAFGGKGGKAEMTMEITDFGVPVDVQAPPADETVDISSLNSVTA